MSELSPLEKLNTAISEFANEQSTDGNVLVDVAVVLWEQIRLDEDGHASRRIRYAVPTDNFSLTSGLGLIEAGAFFVKSDILGSLEPDGDDL